MTEIDNEIPVHETMWRENGGKMMRVIHDHMGEHCYKIRFSNSSKDINGIAATLIFETAETAFMFRLLWA